MKAFIITMIGHELSEKLSLECRTQASKFDVQVEIFPAIWGEEIQKQLDKLELKLGRVKPGKMTPGHYGNFLSHYNLWLKCIDINEAILVLEHDGYLQRSIPSNLCEKFTDICKLDNLNPYAVDYDTDVIKNLDKDIIVKPIEQIKRKKAGFYSWGVYGYIIKPEGAKKLITYISENGFIATDNQVATDVLDVMTCSPSIVRLHPIMAIDRNIYTLSTSRNNSNE